VNRLLARVRGLLHYKSIPIRISTSLSDNQAYPQVCLHASNDYLAFNEFRRDPVYNQILEHVSREQGGDYLRFISGDAEILAAMKEFKRNDDYGNPRMYEYPDVGMVSPSTLRYVKVLSDIRSLFETADNLRICEIGVGYGGQCRIINAFFRPATYCLVDIQPALALANRYLGHYIVHSALTFKTMNELERERFDLVISNYAVSELPRPIQDVYLSKVILPSVGGYLTYNEVTPPEFQSYRSEELAAMIPGARILEEQPLTHAGNCLIVWNGRRPPERG
jgi:hypothetical protein